MSQTDYDVLIVGSGAGGGAALWRLCEQWRNNGKRIGMIEAGNLFVPTHIANIPTSSVDEVGGAWNSPKYARRFQSAVPNGGIPVPVDFLVSTVLGGRTLHWGTACPRMDSSALSHYPVSPEEMNKYYNIAERVMSVTPFLTGDSALQSIMLDRLQNSGLIHAMTCPRAVDLQPTLNGQIHSNVFFSSIIFLAMAMNWRPVDLAVQAHATKVLTRNRSVTGVQVVSSQDKKTYELKARTVVLSTGAMETPRLLLYSGIQGEAIGRFLVNNSRLDAAGAAARSEFPENMGMLDLLLPRSGHRPFQLQTDTLSFYQYRDVPFSEEVRFRLLPSGTVESRYENRVTLDPARTDEFGVPELQVHFSYSEKDFEIIRRMAEFVEQAAEAMQITLLKNDEQSEFFIRPAGGENHDSGTCRMGTDPGISATDPSGQIHGVAGLYVASNSVLPFTGGVNPTLTTVALAIRTADHIMRA
ncbi:GMC family oxidoreductase [Paenibacillus sp. N4]|nr:GMC family oxidoreductase [Paenibacillus vietnamensis]